MLLSFKMTAAPRALNLLTSLRVTNTSTENAYVFLEGAGNKPDRI